MFEFYIRYEYWFAVVQLVLAMLGMGATLRPKDFVEVVLKPKAVSCGLFMQLMCVPSVVFLCIKLLGLDDAVAIGFALIAAIPGGTLSNIFTFFAAGNTALSITITALTTLVCLLSTPLILGWLIIDYMPATFDMPTLRIAIEIVFFLLLPLFLGMLYLRYLNSTAVIFSKWCIRLSLLVILFIVIGALGSGRLDMAAFGAYNILMVFILLLFLLLVSGFICWLFRLVSADTKAIQMEVVVRNINLGLLIKVSLFPAAASNPVGDIVLFTILMYGGFQLLFGAGLIFLGRKKLA